MSLDTDICFFFFAVENIYKKLDGKFIFVVYTTSSVTSYSSQLQYLAYFDLMRIFKFKCSHANDKLT